MKLLEELGAQFEKLTRRVINHTKIDATFNRIGSMFCLFFTSGPIVDVASARRSDLKTFARFFHACLERAIYFAPSQFETGLYPRRTRGRSGAHRRGSSRSAGDLVEETTRVFQRKRLESSTAPAFLFCHSEESRMERLEKARHRRERPEASERE